MHSETGCEPDQRQVPWQNLATLKSAQIGAPCSSFSSEFGLGYAAPCAQEAQPPAEIPREIRGRGRKNLRAQCVFLFWQMLFRMEVLLSHDALFGPDLPDVAAWQSYAIEFIDGPTL